MSFLESPFNPMATFSSQNTLHSISTIDPKLSRTNYYDGRLLKASDLIRDQFYLDERLREVGRVLGQGIVRGLEVELTEDKKTGVKKLIVKPGLAIAPSGRVLELEKTTLNINLLDSAKLYELNPGFRYLDAGLYAVVIQYAESGEGSAEIYPRDLASERGFHFNAYAEGVEFTLVKLHVNLPMEKLRNLSHEEIAVYSRSALVRSLLVANPVQPEGIGEDAVALGLLAIENGDPQWIDKGLLRRPFRHAQSLNYLQTDLYNHYEELLKDILSLRGNSIAKEQFLAKQYFTILPPIGSLPKGSVDPVNGYQHYFPENFEVSISPVRADDIASLLQESMALEPIDLLIDKDVDIMIAVVLDDVSFAFRARQLQHRALANSNSESGDFISPPHLDDILLKNVSNVQSDASSAEAIVWTKLWDSAKQIFYIRRPVRVAETQVSAVVLATGKYEDLLAITAELPVAAELLEDEIDNLSQQLAEKIENNRLLTIEINALTIELNKPLDEKLKAAKAAETAAIEAAKKAIDEAGTATAARALAEAEKESANSRANNAVAEKESAVAEAENVKASLLNVSQQLEESLAEIKRLQEQGGGTDSAALENITQQLKNTTGQLIALEQFSTRLWADEQLAFENTPALEKLRPVTTREANNAMAQVFKFIAEGSASQSVLVRLLMLMPARFDDLNWLSLLATFEQKLGDEIFNILLSSATENYPSIMFKISQEFKFPDKLQAAWQKAQ